MLWNEYVTKNAKEMKFVPESSWHVPASDFQKYRATYTLHDNKKLQ